ncbi:MAG: glycosyltransferase [Methylotenera sp.]|uniref:O-linked N-acetylglucosamine transferase, SPINDLY family protein n=1 Tax=Methylotenera sp. TaxID=2051956 RepID=UPI00248813AF|nr:glycosyltransferase [Methylotenera sp.]MDI1310231.1 glycosyltransferase [Methylotenera sp.]
MAEGVSADLSDNQTLEQLPHDDVVMALIQLFMTGQYVVLEQQLLELLDAQPQWLIGWKMLSDTYMVQKKDATQAAYQALQLNKLDPQEHCYYGLTLKSQNDLIGAAQAFEQAIELKPDYVAAINNLGIVRKDLGDIEQGVACFDRALQIQPAFASCFSNLLFCLSHDEASTAETLWQRHCQFAQYYERATKTSIKKHTNLRASGRPLNIGFVSADLREHSLSNFLEPLLPYLQKNPELNLYAYAATAIEDATSERLKIYFKHWQVVDQLNDEDLANKVRCDAIDILVDLDGHTSGNRLTMFALKPAPIQVSWLGYLATTGLSNMDYYLADEYLLPQGQFDKQFTEKLVQLPINAPFSSVTESPDVNSLPALNNGYLTFACFNRTNKITQSTVQLWSSVLVQLPSSKCILIGDAQSGNHKRIFDWFKQYGVDLSRVVWLPRTSMQEYLALHHQVDICLDTMPANGVTTTCHAAWMGVPTLCISGDRMISRGAQAIMRHLSLGDFVVADAATYLAKACYFSDNLAGLAETRQQLRYRFQQSLFSQHDIAAKAVSVAFRQMWKRWCAGKQAKAFVVRL